MNKRLNHGLRCRRASSQARGFCCESRVCCGPGGELLASAAFTAIARTVAAEVVIPLVVPLALVVPTAHGWGGLYRMMRRRHRSWRCVAREPLRDGAEVA